MRGLLLLVVIAVVGFFAYTHGLPFLERMASGKPAEAEIPSDSPRRCVELAEGASRTVSDQLSQFAQPPVDPSLWAAALLHTGGELTSAETACGCGTTACASSSLAVTEMRRLLNQFSRAVQGDGVGFENPALYRERIDSLLAQARASLP